MGRGELATAIADQPIKQHLIHETVIAELAARRSGSHSTLTRGKVRGGGAKPWRQKGTGRARQGSTRAPHWTGGGIVFGPTPRTYGGKVNRKVRQQAFRAALRAQVERGSAAVLDPTGWETPSTKAAVEYLRQAPEGLQVRPLLIVLGDLGSVEARSFRNVPGVYVLEASELQTVDIVAARAILVERAAWERLTGGELAVETVSPGPQGQARAQEEGAAQAHAGGGGGRGGPQAQAHPRQEGGPGRRRGPGRGARGRGAGGRGGSAPRSPWPRRPRRGAGGRGPGGRRARRGRRARGR